LRRGSRGTGSSSMLAKLERGAREHEMKNPPSHSTPYTTPASTKIHNINLPYNSPQSLLQCPYNPACFQVLPLLGCDYKWYGRLLMHLGKLWRRRRNMRRPVYPRERRRGTVEGIYALDGLREGRERRGHLGGGCGC